WEGARTAGGRRGRRVRSARRHPCLRRTDPGSRPARSPETSEGRPGDRYRRLRDGSLSAPPPKSPFRPGLGSGFFPCNQATVIGDPPPGKASIRYLDARTSEIWLHDSNEALPLASVGGNLV